MARSVCCARTQHKIAMTALGSQPPNAYAAMPVQQADRHQSSGYQAKPLILRLFAKRATVGRSRAEIRSQSVESGWRARSVDSIFSLRALAVHGSLRGRDDQRRTVA